MPPLVAFGRKWEIGSDDLVYPGIRNLLLRIPWLIGTIVVYWQNYDKLTCGDNGGQYVRIFLLGAIGFLSLMIGGDLLLIYNSSRGGIMDTRARRFVPICLYIKVAFYLIELGWNSLGTYGYSQGLLTCDEAPETTVALLGLIICNWILLLLFLSFWLWQYDSIGRSKSEIGNHAGIHLESFDHAHGTPMTTRTGQWEKRLRFIFCMVLHEGRSESVQNVYKEAAGAFSYMFHNKNLVLSDAVAGTVLNCLKTQRLRRKTISTAPRFRLTSSINFDPATNSIKLPPADDWNSVSSILHFLNYGLGVYTLPGAFCFRRRKFLGALCTKTQCCNFMPGRKEYPINVEKDNCCYWKSASLRTFLDDEDLVYASYDNANFCCPFFVSVDHSTSSIVIVIRGSFSFVDFLVDCSVTPVPMDINGVPTEFKAHRGMLTVAKTIKKRLDKMEILTKLTRSHPNYKIMVTGISLGAGVSSILSIILRQEFQNVKCLAFSVPGGLLSLDAAEYCNDFLTSIVYGDDIVPRLNIPSFNHAVNKIQSILYTSNTPKYRIQLSLATSLCGIGKLTANFRDDENVVHDQNLMPEPKLSNSRSNLMHDGTKYLPEEIRAKALERFRHFPPGKILYVTQTQLFSKKHRKKEDMETPRYEVKWADRTEFNEVIFSNRMIIDHLPFRLISALKYFSRFKSQTVAVDEVVTTGPKSQIKMEKG